MFSSWRISRKWLQTSDSFADCALFLILLRMVGLMVFWSFVLQWIFIIAKSKTVITFLLLDSYCSVLGSRQRRPAKRWQVRRNVQGQGGNFQPPQVFSLIRCKTFIKKSWYQRLLNLRKFFILAPSSKKCAKSLSLASYLWGKCSR